MQCILIHTLLSVQKQTCSDSLIMVLNCSVGMVLQVLSLTDKNSFDLESVVRVPYLQDNLSENTSVLVNMPLPMHIALSTVCSLLGVQFLRSLVSNVCSALTSQNMAVNNTINPHTRHTTTLQSTVFLNGTHQLLVISI
jgi:hypothetical protein